jgi:branched-chain amino acid transport system ATP-binding protein
MTMLRLTGLTKSFGGLMAVNAVSFDVGEGAVVGLLGPHGAGKTPVFNLITGPHRAARGTIHFEGRDITNWKTHRIVRLGIARTFQTIRLFQNLSVLENVLAGCPCRMRSGPAAAMLRMPGERREEKAALERALAELGSWAWRARRCSSRRTSPTAASASSRSRGPWPRNPDSSSSTSRRGA